MSPGESALWHILLTNKGLRLPILGVELTTPHFVRPSPPTTCILGCYRLMLENFISAPYLSVFWLPDAW